MTVWAWRTSGVPPLSAFMPAITKSAVSWQRYKGDVDGQPGTQGIPAPNNDIPQDRFAVSADHRSSDAMAAWYPSLYFESRLPGLPFPAGGNDAGVRVYSDNQLPVPAIEPQRGTHRLGGGRVVQPFQNTYRRAVTRRVVSPRNG